MPRSNAFVTNDDPHIRPHLPRYPLLVPVLLLVDCTFDATDQARTSATELTSLKWHDTAAPGR